MTLFGPTGCAWTCGWDPLQRETPMNGIGTQLLLHTPAIDLSDHLGFGLVDSEVLWRGCRLVDVGVAIGWISQLTALAGRKELPAAGAFVDQGPLVLAKTPCIWRSICSSGLAPRF